ncbi:MAG: acyl-CoA dehydrogenase family protein, partial [Gammaproteobacteria bacterium]
MSASLDTAPQSRTARDEILTLLADSARDFCDRSLDKARLRGLRGTSPAFDRAGWRAMAELGWLGVVLPEDRGGLDQGAGGAGVLARALGRAAAPEPFVETAVAGARLLLGCDAPDAPLQALLDGETVFAAALGAFDEDVFGRVDARADDATMRLDGVFAAVPLGADADAFVVPASLGGEPAWLVVA